MLRLVAIVHLRHIADPDHGASHGFNGQIVQCLDHFRVAVQSDTVFGFPDFRRAAGQHEILGIERIDNIHRGQVLGFKRRQIDINGDNPRFAAGRVRHGCAPYGRKTHLDAIHGHVLKLLFGKFRTGQTVLQDRDAGCIVAEDERRIDPQRKNAQHRLSAGGYLSHAVGHGSTGLKKHLDHARAIVSGGFDVFDIIHQGADHALVVIDDALLHLFGVQAVINPDHTDDRNVDLRKNVRRRAQQHERCQ